MRRANNIHDLNFHIIVHDAVYKLETIIVVIIEGQFFLVW